ncbi:c2 domain-containing protein [Anaeramoeba flamelloides]|uniref:C2 domain-containing protein n=1 Tax=Anaeramoeba flamelloides TaxID=1746091 RepID=A0ABQ8Z6R5_9EUKA|nr:c2 domain-containing protein [Anaeramoeba flamelloides]
MSDTINLHLVIFCKHTKHRYNKGHELFKTKSLLKKLLNDKTITQKIVVSSEVVNNYQKTFVLFDLKEISKRPIDEDNLIVYQTTDDKPSRYIGGYNKLRLFLKNELKITYPDHMDELTKEDFQNQDKLRNNLRKFVSRRKTISSQKHSTYEKNYLLIIRPIEGTNMPKMDRFGECDTYLEISILNSLHKPLQSSVCKKTFNPKWSVIDPLLYFVLSDEETLELKIKVDVYDKDLITSTKFGSFTFNVSKTLYPLGATIKKSFVVKIFKKNKNFTGEAKISLGITLLDESISYPTLPEEK